MSRGTAFVRLIDDLLNTELIGRGFARRTPGVFTTTLAGRDGASGWVGLNRGRVVEGAHNLNVFVGVRHERTEALLEQWVPNQRTHGISATAVTNLRGLLPRTGLVTEWLPLFEFEPSIDPAPVVSEIGDLVDDYGRPYMVKLADDPDALLARIGDSPQWELMLPAALAAFGRWTEAQAVVDRELEALKTAAPSDWSIMYRRFARKLRECVNR